MKCMSHADIPTKWGVFTVYTYGESETDPMPHIALVHKDLTSHSDVLVRIHSECITGDLFGSTRCECGSQLIKSFEEIGADKGIIVYLRQEGRGIGIIQKLKAYQLQDQGLNTIEANVELGHAPDERSFDLGVQILEDLQINSIRLLTNNPDKIQAIEKSGIDLIERIPLIVTPSKHNMEYMQTKKDIMGHLLD